MSLDICVVTGTIHNPMGGAPMAGATLYIRKVVKAGKLITTPTPGSATSDAGGIITLELPRASTAYLWGDVEGLNTQGLSSYGIPIPIPDAETADLEDLMAVASVPTAGLTVKADGTPLGGLYGSLNFGDGFLVTGDAGEASVELGDLDATFATDAALTAAVAAEGAARAAADALLQPTSEKNQANGYAGLNASGLIPDVRIPSSIARNTEVTAAVAAESAARSAAISALDLEALTDVDLTNPASGDFLWHDGAGWVNSPLDASDIPALPTSKTTGLQDALDAKLAKASNLSDLVDAAVARVNLGLGNVNNTSDADKPVSTAQASALALKANLASPALTGTPTAPTAAGGTNTTQLATTAFVTSAVAAVPTTAPGGSTTQLQRNNAGAFGGISGATSDGNNVTFGSGSLKLAGATSGTATLQAPAAAGSAVVTLPNASSTLPVFSQQVTFAGPTAARTFTLPDASATLARTDAAQTFTGTQTFSTAGASGLKVMDGATTVLDVNPSGTGRVVGQFYDRTDLFALASHLQVASSFAIFWQSAGFWYSGSSDLAIKRAKAGVLGLGDTTTETNGTTFRAKARTATQLTANQNDYNPGGVSMFQRWSSDASRSVTGLSIAQVDGEVHTVINVGSNAIVLVHESASSTAANRFLNSTGADITLSANQAADLIYDSASARWRVSKRN